MKKKICAATKIQCPASKQRHSVVLYDDGSTTCDCPEGAVRGSSLAGRILLGAPAPDGVRGCGALIALAEGASSLLQLDRGTDSPNYGPWGELVFAYGKNPVYRAALDLAEEACPERPKVRQVLLDHVESAGYKHKLGKLRFRTEFKTLWDVPATVECMDKLLVSAFDDDPWSVPYQPNWKEQICDKGLAVVDGKVVCGRSAEDPSILFAITKHEAGQAHWVRQHKLRGRRLVELTA